MDFEDELDRGPSRGERKREAEDLQKLGEALVALADEQLKAIPLDSDLREAIEMAKRITARGGHRRQLQLVGKLMRNADIAPIRAGLEQMKNRGTQAVARQKQAERWRERLLTEGDTAVAEFLVAYPGADVQRLRQLIQGVRREHIAGKPPRLNRELFKLVVSSLDL